ncbi:MAG TPA: HAD family phosphatase [Methanocella sp.]|nr:HAD family phosphatase [Methanocella sp.]
MAERCSVEIFVYRAALFDMDGVITDTMPLHYESWKRAFEPYCINVYRMDVYRREGMTSTAMGREIARDKGKELPEEELKGIVEEKTRIFERLVKERAKAYEGVPETLMMLRNNGLKLALVTGSRRSSVDLVLKKVGLEDAFDVIVGAGDIKEGKPSPEPYLAAMKRLDMPALNCVVVENSPLGIMSARAAKAGYVIALMTTLEASYLEEADDIVSTFSDLEQCFARRFEARPGRAIR